MIYWQDVKKVIDVIIAKRHIGHSRSRGRGGGGLEIFIVGFSSFLSVYLAALSPPHSKELVTLVYSMLKIVHCYST